MTTGILLTSVLWLLFQPAQSMPTITGPIRNTFAVAAETVIDDASAVNVKADESVFNAQFEHLKTSKDTLLRMANDDREKDIASSANNMLFLISACHVQAKDGASTTQCEAQLNRARTAIMESISKHKTGGTWAEGPPA